MAKVSNETRLMIHLFKERAKRRREEIKSDSCKDWAQGVQRGLLDAEKILTDIIDELERGHKL